MRRSPQWKRKLKAKRRRFVKKTPLGKLKKKLNSLSRPQLIKYLAIFCFAGILLFTLVMAVVFAWNAKNLPQPDKIVRREGFSTKIYDKDGVLLYDVFADQKRTPVELEKVPEYLQQATIAIEDKNFYKHKGFDPTGWLRAVFTIVFKGRLQGGSTLTQQLVKNVLLSPQRTITRKIKEFVLAVQIENKYSKDEILQMYLNEAPYGGTAWGVETAAETYFGKKVENLSLVESAFLAGLPQRPSFYSPYSGDSEAYKIRTQSVLRRMKEDEYITEDQHQQALEHLEDLEFEKASQAFKAPHFVMYVKKLLEQEYGKEVVEKGGLQVVTSLDWEIQKQAQEIVSKEIEKVESLHITNGAAMVIEPDTGEIKAMVGSKDYFAENYDGQVNVCLSLRQPGSAIKPVTYATAFKKGYTPAFMLADVVTHFPGGAGQQDYVPKNYDNKEHGPVQLRFALGSSLNIPSVKILALVGVDSMLKTAFDMGLNTLEPTQENIGRLGLSVTLGGGEVRLIDLASAYSAFANGGQKIEPVSILEVKDQKGKVLHKHKQIKGKRVLTEEQAYLINNILSDNNARLITFGENSLLNIPTRSVAVKTGTTDDMRDNWAIGWTPDSLVAVWVGNNDNSAMNRVASGISGASPIWRDIIMEVLEEELVKEFSIPEGIEKKEIDVVSGWPAHDDFSSRQEYFVQGTVPSGSDPIHKKMKVCKGQTDKLAPDTLIEKGEYEEKEFIILKEDDPISTDKNRWQEAIDRWINEQEDGRYKYPKEYCSTDEDLLVDFNKPKNGDKLDNEFEVELSIAGNHKIKQVKLYAKNELKETFTNKPYKTKLVLGDGVYKLKAKVKDEKDNTREKEIEVFVNVEEEPESEPTVQPSPTPEETIQPSPSVSPTPSDE